MSRKKPSALFAGGIPTSIDVGKLLQAFGVPEENEVITHEEIENTIGTGRRSHRYGTVLAAWKRALETKHNVILGSVPGVGYKALPPTERIDMATSKYRSGLRATGRASNVAMSTDRSRLDDEARRAQDFLRSINAKLRLAAATTAKEITYPEPSANSIYARRSTA